MRTSKKRKTEKVKKEINGDEETKAVSEVILHSIAHVTSLKIAFEVAFECTHASDMKVGISLYLVTPCNNVRTALYYLFQSFFGVYLFQRFFGNPLFI